jgi:hypothetical protein
MLCRIATWFRGRACHSLRLGLTHNYVNCIIHLDK